MCQTISIACFATVLNKFARYDTRQLSGKLVYKDSEVPADPLVIRRDKFIILLARWCAVTIHATLRIRREQTVRGLVGVDISWITICTKRIDERGSLERGREEKRGVDLNQRGAGRLSEGSDTLVRASRSRDFVRATTRRICLLDGLFRSNAFDSSIYCVPVVVSFFISFTSLGYGLRNRLRILDRDRKNFLHSRLCVYF